MNRFLMVVVLSAIIFGGCYTQYTYRVQQEEIQDSTLYTVDSIYTETTASIENDYLCHVNTWAWWDTYWSNSYFSYDYQWRYPWYYNRPHYLGDNWYWGWRDWNYQPHYYRPHIYFGFRWNLGSHNYIRQSHRYYNSRPILHQSLRADISRPEYRRESNRIPQLVYRGKNPRVYSNSQVGPRFNREVRPHVNRDISRSNQSSYGGRHEMSRPQSNGNRNTGRSSSVPQGSRGSNGNRSNDKGRGR